jgi:hypothetical protein
MNAGLLKRASQGLLLLMAVAMIDTCTSAVRTPMRVFPIVAGQAAPISGKLDGRVLPPPGGGSLFSGNRVSAPDQLARVLRVASSSPDLDIRLIERNGRLWRAMLRVYPGTREGDYPIHVFQAGEAPGEENRYSVRVFQSTAARNRAAPSLMVRWLGVAPWWILIGLVPFVAGMLTASWRASRREEDRLRSRGIGVIYKLARTKNHWELVAGLGSEDGVERGARVLLVSRDLRPIADLRVDALHPRHLTAEVGLEVPVTPHCFVTQGADGPPRVPPPGEGEPPTGR